MAILGKSRMYATIGTRIGGLMVAAVALWLAAAVTGAVDLASAQLQVTLTTDPTPLLPIRFLRTGGLGGTKFGISSLYAFHGGKL